MSDIPAPNDNLARPATPTEQEPWPQSPMLERSDGINEQTHYPTPAPEKQGKQMQRATKQDIQQKGKSGPLAIAKKEKDKDALSLRLELNLEVEITLRAKIHGDLTLALMA